MFFNTSRIISINPSQQFLFIVDDETKKHCKEIGDTNRKKEWNHNLQEFKNVWRCKIVV